MRAKSLILLTVALGCGMVAAVAVSKTLMERESGQTEEATVEILVAAAEIKNASKISVEKVKLDKWPRSRVPTGVLTNIKDIEGKFASQNIFPGEALIAQKLNNSNDSAGTNLPAGHTLFDIPYDNNYIKPGDWVDISGTFTAGGKNSSKAPEVKTVLRGVQVWGINGNPDRNMENKGAKGTLFNLLIKQSQYQALLLASNMGKLDLNIRPLDEDGNIKTAAEDTGETFLNWAKEQAGPAVASNVEPLEKPVSISVPQTAPQPQPEPQPKQAKSEILIMTADGVKRYEYSGNELPREVSQNTQDSKSSNNQLNPWQSSSGYGGYSPTYPTTYANAPGGPASDTSAFGQRPGTLPSSSPPTNPTTGATGGAGSGKPSSTKLIN
ncbi:MAG: Flp pilus assembly protein CpaB [Pirellulales bacterium]